MKGEERVLEIGTGSGYQTALLAELAKAIFTIERIQALIHRAEEILQKLGYENISFLRGDGTEGWPGKAPSTGLSSPPARPRFRKRSPPNWQRGKAGHPGGPPVQPDAL